MPATTRKSQIELRAQTCSARIDQMR